MTEKKEDKFIQWVLFATGISSILIIILIIAFIFSEGLPAIFSIGLFNFIFGMIWNHIFSSFDGYTIIIMLFYFPCRNCPTKYEKIIKTNHTGSSRNTICYIWIFWFSNHCSFYKDSFWRIRIQCNFSFIKYQVVHLGIVIVFLRKQGAACNNFNLEFQTFFYDPVYRFLLYIHGADQNIVGPLDVTGLE